MARLGSWLPQAALMALVALALLLANPADSLANVAAIYSGLVAFAAMSVNLVLGARLPVVERLFHGMDKMFLQHRHFGYLAMAAAVAHWANNPSFPQFLAACDDVCKTAIESGEIAFNALMVLGVLSWLRRRSFRGLTLPYHWWKLTHFLLLAVWAAACFHLMFNRKMPATYQQLAEVFGLLGIAALILYIAGAVLRRVRSRRYEVEAISREGDVIGIRARPTGRGVAHRSGQFAFIRADRKGLREAHPFTISGGETPDGAVQFNIKKSGDFTARLLEDLQEGDTMTVEGPYGRFDYPRRGGKQVWIAAGIGITPFLSFVRSMPDSLSGEVELIYLVRTRDEAVGLEEFQAADRRVDGFRFTLHPSKEKGRWPGLDVARGDVDAVLFCGPPVLRNILKKQFGRKLHFEYFEF